MSFSAFGTADNIPSSWPAGLKYNPQEAKYVFSISNAVEIAALEHVHVVDIDLPQVESIPNVMTLTLPIQANLPLGSRMYFFYVSRSTEGDQLQFIPVSGSGNTINGNAFGYTFTLTGVPELFICLGMNDNYIIHVFGQNNAVDDDEFPTEFYQLSPLADPLFGTSPSAPFPGAADIFPGNGASSAATTVITGMEGFLTPNTPVTAQPFDGYLCNVDGIYLINPTLNAHFDYTVGAAPGGTNLGPYLSNWLEFDGAGIIGSAPSTASFIPFTPQIAPIRENFAWVYNTSFFLPMLRGNTYLPSFSWDNSSAGTNGEALVSGTITFVYWAPLPPGPTLSIASLAGPASLVRAANTDPKVFAPISKPISGPVAASLQRTKQNTQALKSRARGTSLSAPSSSSSDSSASAPQFSLADMETMINRALDARDKQQPRVGQTSSASVSFSSSSSSGSSSSSAKTPEPKRRKLSSVSSSSSPSQKK